MKIRFNQLDDTNREFHLINGVYTPEYDVSKKWIWTSQKFDGVVSNINYVILTINSEIPNMLYYDESEVELYPDCVNVIKMKTFGKTSFEVRLANPHIVSSDTRILGVKITRIVLDQDVVF
jgi:hypothetical protein